MTRMGETVTLVRKHEDGSEENITVEKKNKKVIDAWNNAGEKAAPKRSTKKTASTRKRK